MSRTQIQDQLREVLEKGLAPMHAQPIILADGRIHGVEGFLRVADFPVSKVLAEAKVSGCLSEIELAVLRSCIRMAAEREDIGVVHVNASWTSLSEPGFAGHLSGMIAAFGVDPGRIAIELSESEFVINHKQAAMALRALRDAGVCFAIDDFGVGYNHLSIVSAVPIHCIKIDQSIVHAATRGETEEEKDRANRLVLGTKLLAKTLGAELIIEGIETPLEKALMAGLECAGQGFLLGRPVSIEDLVLPGQLRCVA